MTAASATAETGSRSREAWRHRLAAQRGVLLAVTIFVAMFAVYGWKQEVGLTASIINTATNKGALLALVAMAQTLPVLIGGLDLSVGSIFVLTNCLASNIVVGGPLMTALGIVGVLAVGLVRKGVDFHAVDEKPVRVFFVLVSPEKAPAAHLQVLAAISKWVKNGQAVDDILAGGSRERIYQLLDREG